MGNHTRILGITGGVGSGKSEILKYLEEKYHMEVIKADEVAHDLIEIGGECYDAICALFGDGILKSDRSIDRAKMAKVMFDSDSLRKEVNSIIHPAVKRTILKMIEEASDRKVPYVLIEAALMVEEDYAAICDEIWYIYASVKTRTQRLKETRNYSDEKIRQIMDAQMSEEVYTDYCDVKIDNDGNFDQTRKQIDRILGDRRKKRIGELSENHRS